MSGSKGNDEVKTRIPRRPERNGEKGWCSLGCEKNTSHALKEIRTV